MIGTAKPSKSKRTIHSSIFNDAGVRVYPQELGPGDHFTQEVGDKLLYGAVVLSPNENETRLVLYGSRKKVDR